MTLSGSTCTFTVGKNDPPNSAYQTYFEASDRSNTTLSAIQYVEINAVKSDGGGILSGDIIIYDENGNPIQSSIGSSGNPFAPKKDNTWLLIGIAVGAYFLLSGKKK